MSKKSQIKWFQKRSCVCKERFTSLKDGLIALLECRTKGWTVNNVYKCYFCNSYHIGHIKHRTRRYVKECLK